MDNTEEFRLLSLCSGYAGLELGLREIIPNLRTVAYVEVEAFACANLVGKMEKGFLDVAPVWTDIKSFNGWPFRGNVHIITAGYPCQGESHAGKRKGKDDPRWLWPHIERIIEAVEPVWFFGENVSGHLTLGFPTVYRSLRNLGYTVEAGLFTAAECGAPHRRERLFILAYNENGRFTGSNLSIRQPQRQKQAKINPVRIGKVGNSQRTGQQSSIYGQGQTQFRRTSTRWPARPGQPQYEWEEPRVVANSKQRCRRRQDGNSQRLQCQTEITRPNEGQAQSRLGRAVNGTPCRVDRLRLLGNGVVPQQAEKAFRYLMGLF